MRIQILSQMEWMTKSFLVHANFDVEPTNSIGIPDPDLIDELRSALGESAKSVELAQGCVVIYSRDVLKVGNADSEKFIETVLRRLMDNGYELSDNQPN